MKFVERRDSRPIEEFQRLADIDNTLLGTACVKNDQQIDSPF